MDKAGSLAELKKKKKLGLSNWKKDQVSDFLHPLMQFHVVSLVLETFNKSMQQWVVPYELKIAKQFSILRKEIQFWKHFWQ